MNTKQKEKEVQLSDYKQAKKIASTLKEYESVIIQVVKVENFRKYIRDVCNGKQFLTRLINKDLQELQVTRLK